MVLQRTDTTAPAGWVNFSIEEAHPFPVVAGRSISLLALTGVVALLLTLGTRRFRRPIFANDAEPTA